MNALLNTNDPERARDALFFIDPGCTREDWVRIGMAAKSAGMSFDDFHTWSAEGNNYKNEQDCITVWRSLKESGGITPATLFDEAYKQGWTNSNGAHLKPSPVPHTPRDPIKKPDNPAPKTWEICTEAPPDNPYIVRKHGNPDGLRVYPDNAPPLIIKNQSVAGWLVLPAWSNEQLQTIQFIPPNGGEKLNHAGASFNDGYFTVGNMPDNLNSGEIYVVEGIGQGWAVNQVKRCPAIVCFGAGRMQRIAKVLRAKYPSAKLVIIPDKGKESEAAKIAATVSGYWVVMPEDKPGNYDVNDYLLEFGDDALASLLAKPKSPPPPHDEAFVNDGINYEEMPDYGESTTPKSGLTWSDGDFMADNATAPEYLINDILETDSHGVLAGASQAFKTFADLRMVYSICTGNDFFGHEVFTTGKVLYVCGEGMGALKRRLKALKIVEGDFKGNLCILDHPIRIDSQADMAMLRQSIEKINPILVVFDTFASLVSITNENDPSEVGRVLKLVKETCRHGKTSSLITHHYGKDASKGARGASNFFNDGDFFFEMTRAADSMLATLSCKKMKDGETFDDIYMQAHVVELGIIRQDGKIATSLVLKPTDEKPDTGRKGKPLDSLHTKILASLYEALDAHGISPPPEIISRFPDSPQNCPKKVVHINDFRPFAYPHLNVAQNSKRTVLKRCITLLEDNNKTMFYNDYLWSIT